MKRKKLMLIAIIVSLAALAICLVVFLVPKENSNYLTKGLAYKMLALLEADKDVIDATSDYFDEDESKWYEKYMNYLYANGLVDADSNKPTNAIGDKKFTYGDLKFYLNASNVDLEDVSEFTGVDVLKAKNKAIISRTDFMEIYDYLVAVYGSEDGVHAVNFVLCGTPANVEGARQWTAYTSIGEYGFEGLAIDRYMDNEVMAYVRGREIVSIVLKITDEITYHNAWLLKGEKNELVAYIGNARRTFLVDELEENFDKVIGDISLTKQKVTGIVLKPDTISGKVLMMDQKKVEIEGYGEILLEENFRVYKNYGVVEEKSVSDILVGYDLTDFVIAGDKICAAVISRDLKADNIRVMIMSTGFTSLFHERVSLTGTGDFTVKYGEETKHYKAGEIVDIYDGSEFLKAGRIVVESDNSTDKITVLTVKKSYGNPSYSGKIEVSKSADGLIIINDIPMEEYLYAVVPSEMPSSFGVEALKVQSVCARSYAYIQLLGNAYGRYGAHVDDSTNFQVYNNSKTSEDAIQAVRETYGQVVSYNNSPISTYYYSTSCGVSSDVSVWGNASTAMPFLVNVKVNPENKSMDLSSNEAFKKYIMSTDEMDFDYGYPYYRWNVTMSLEDLSESINNSIFARYHATPKNILVKQNNGWVSKEIRSIGKLLKIEVTKRTQSGCVREIIFYGTENTVKVSHELGLRYLLNVGDNQLNMFNGKSQTSKMLPSAFCYFEPVMEGGSITGYTITGGGYGHGIGMSQNAVANMVKSGMTYDAILQFFYQGTKLINVYSE